MTVPTVACCCVLAESQSRIGLTQYSTSHQLMNITAQIELRVFTEIFAVEIDVNCWFPTCYVLSHMYIFVYRALFVNRLRRMTKLIASVSDQFFFRSGGGCHSDSYYIFLNWRLARVVQFRTGKINIVPVVTHRDGSQSRLHLGHTAAGHILLAKTCRAHKMGS